MESGEESTRDKSDSDCSEISLNEKVNTSDIVTKLVVTDKITVEDRYIVTKLVETKETAVDN